MQKITISTPYNVIVLCVILALSILYTPLVGYHFIQDVDTWIERHELLGIIIGILLSILPGIVLGISLRSANYLLYILSIIILTIGMSCSVGFFGWPESFTFIEHINISIKIFPLILLCNTIGIVLSVVSAHVAQSTGVQASL